MMPTTDTDPELFTTEVLKAAEKPVPAYSFYVVVAFYTPQGYWKVFHPARITEVDARNQVADLPRCYTHARIHVLTTKDGDD